MINVLQEKEQTFASCPFYFSNEFFKNRQEILAVYLFGSCAGGRNTPLSDIDLAFLFFRDHKDRIDYNYLAELQLELIRISGFEDIDTVILNDREPVFLYNVLTEGRLLYYIDNEEFTEFLYDSYRLYLDFMPSYRFWEEIYYGT
ncbi:MAG: nucleotidyltransferase domain-containing protein [Candidatus Eremiobacterota bacterium]